MSDMPTNIMRDAVRDAMTTAPPKECLDLETIAAWSDGSLHARQRVAAESHAAACARCQAILAAMTRTTPVAVRRWGLGTTVRWVAPLAAAAALALWIAVPGPHTPRSVSVRQPAPPVAAPAAKPAPASSAAAQSAPNPLRAEQGPAGISAPSGAPAPQPLQRSSDRPLESSAVSGGAATEAMQHAFPAAPPEPPPSKVDAFFMRRPAGSPAAASPRASAEAVGSGARALDMAKANAGLPTIAAPTATARWRIVRGREIERSIDAGSTWQPVPFPQSTELASIRASDELSATVTAADGRMFTTVDGGKTWR